MNKYIKAIETEYKGYKFRSRLEARWAVFFDALDIKWCYELEGYEFSNGVRYLPDFYLPNFHQAGGIFVEVKPEICIDSKAKALAFFSGTPVLMACGVPELREYDLIFGQDLFSSVMFYDKYLKGGSNEDEYRFFVEPCLAVDESRLIKGEDLEFYEDYLPKVFLAIAEAKQATFNEFKGVK
jgi:hypothetical protein